MRVQAGDQFLQRRAASPLMAIALEGGGARGLAHIVVLEAREKFGIRPVAITGISMGATFAACSEVRQIHARILTSLHNWSNFMARLLRARVGRFADAVLRARLANLP